MVAAQSHWGHPDKETSCGQKKKNQIQSESFLLPPFYAFVSLQNILCTLCLYFYPILCQKWCIGAELSLDQNPSAGLELLQKNVKLGQKKKKNGAGGGGGGGEEEGKRGEGRGQGRGVRAW